MIRAATLERVLLLLSDFLALTICFVLAYWVQFHSGWIAEKFDPSKTLDAYWHIGCVLNICWLAWFTLLAFIAHGSFSPELCRFCGCFGRSLWVLS